MTESNWLGNYEHVKDYLKSDENDTCEHGNSYASNCSDCDEDAITEAEYKALKEVMLKELENN